MNLLQEKWEKSATIRCRPRVHFDIEHKGYFYPFSRQPLCIHPDIQGLNDQDLHYLLLQSFYKYNNDIATIETNFVNQAILLVINNKLPIFFTSQQKLDLYTVMIDETYHAYVAYDAMQKIEIHTGIKSLPLPSIIEIELALLTVQKKLPFHYHSLFLLIAVCVAENTLTKDIINMMHQPETHPFFQRIIQDHYADESRHAGIFFNLLSYIWQNISDDCKQQIAIILPEFLTLYLDIQIQNNFDKQIMLALNFTEATANKILHDTYSHFKVTHDHPMLKNILTILDKAGVIDEFTTPYFETINWFSPSLNC